MCTVLLPPGGNPIAVNKYIISHQILTTNLRFSDLRVSEENNKLCEGNTDKMGTFTELNVQYFSN